MKEKQEMNAEAENVPCLFLLLLTIAFNETETLLPDI